MQTGGAYAKLSPGNQKMAQALFDAQKPSGFRGATSGPSTTTGTSGVATGASPGTRKPLTLDQMAALKQSGQGWDEIFKQLKAQGQEKKLVQQK